MSYILFDIGGTKTRVAVSEDLKSFGELIKFPTPVQFEEGVEMIVKAAKDLTSSEIRGAAGGIRGVLNSDKTMMLNDPGDVLKNWEEKPIVHSLKKRLKTKVYLNNDAAVVGLGEAVFGSGKGNEIVVYHTVSTGVGGVRIINNQISPATNGFEPGQQILDVDRTVLGPDEMPTLENLVSGGSLERRLGMKPYDIPQEDAIWDQLAGYLGQGLRNTILYWSPDIIVLGGSMVVGDPRIFLNDIRRHTEIALDGIVPCPPIVDAAFRDDGGLYGAMALLQAEV